MTRTPILIVGDAPSALSGLGRITRDLATRIHANIPEFEVATYGYGGSGDKFLPFQQYSIEDMENWYMPHLRDVWENFAGERKGIILTLWDASRLLWFARPETCADREMRTWLEKPPFQKWGYFPMDATGPYGRLSYAVQSCIVGYDRILAYSKWAEDMIRRSLPESQCSGLQSLPHGINTSVFTPRDRHESRKVFTSKLHFNGPDLKPNEKLIGIVATNQARKDFGLAMEAIAQIKYIPIRIYIQTDILERYWSIPTLLMDYGLMSRAIVNVLPITDDVMSYVYSACDVTLGIGAGEGFGFPIFESLACGTPCVTGNYGGHAEHMAPLMLIEPKAYRIEGCYDCVRPVYDPKDLADTFPRWISMAKTGKSLLPSGLAWPEFWPKWEAWFRVGLHV